MNLIIPLAAAGGAFLLFRSMTSRAATGESAAAVEAAGTTPETGALAHGTAQPGGDLGGVSGDPDYVPGQPTLSGAGSPYPPDVTAGADPSIWAGADSRVTTPSTTVPSKKTRDHRLDPKSSPKPKVTTRPDGSRMVSRPVTKAPTQSCAAKGGSCPSSPKSGMANPQAVSKAIRSDFGFGPLVF